MTTERIEADAPQRKNIHEAARVEVKNINALIPRKGLPVDQRAALNTQIRGILPKTSDIALVWLTQRGHELSRRELLLRIESKKITQFQSLLEIMMPVHRQKMHVMGDKLFKSAYELALELASTASQEAVIDSTRNFIKDGVFKSRDFLETILSQRTDLDAVKEKTADLIEGNSISNAAYLLDHLTVLIDGAQRLRSQRPQLHK